MQEPTRRPNATPSFPPHHKLAHLRSLRLPPPSRAIGRCTAPLFPTAVCQRLEDRAPRSPRPHSQGSNYSPRWPPAALADTPVRSHTDCRRSRLWSPHISPETTAEPQNHLQPLPTAAVQGAGAGLRAQLAPSEGSKWGGEFQSRPHEPTAWFQSSSVQSAERRGWWHGRATPGRVANFAAIPAWK